MRTIHKKILKLAEYQEIEIVGLEKILKISEQNGEICVWYIIQTENELSQNVGIDIYGTGFDLKSYTKNYFDTLITSNGLVWHIFINLNK